MLDLLLHVHNSECESVDARSDEAPFIADQLRPAPELPSFFDLH